MTSVTDSGVMACIEMIQKQIRRKIRKINCGGCAVFAGALAARMEELGIPVAIRILNDCLNAADEIDVREIEERLRKNYVDLDDISNWHDNGVFFGHVMVEWNGFLIDGEHYQDIESFNRNGWWANNNIAVMFKGSMSIETTQMLATQEYGWNTLYDRWQNEEVFEIIDEYMSILEA